MKSFQCIIINSVLLLQACAFKGSDPSSPSIPLYRSQKCTAVDLSSGNLDETGVSGLISCLNRDNQLGKISDSWNDLSHQDQKLISRVIDREFVRDSKFRTDFLNSNSKIKVDANSKIKISQFLKLSGNSQVFKTLKPIFQNTFLNHDGEIKPESEKVIKNLLNDATQEAPYLAAQVMTQILSSKWSKTFFNKIKNRSSANASEALKEYWSYFKKAGKEKSLFRVLFEKGADGSLGAFFDNAIRTGYEADKIVKTDLVFQSLSESIDGVPSRIGIKNAKLFSALHNPIYCLNGAQEALKSDEQTVERVIKFGTSNPKDYLKRENLLSLMTIKPFCEYPKGLNENYEALRLIADSNAVQEVTDLLKVFYDHGLNPALSVFFSEKEIEPLLKVFKEISDADLWKDFFILLTLPDYKDKETSDILSHVARKTLESPDHQSFYDLMIQGFSELSLTQIRSILDSIQNSNPGDGIEWSHSFIEMLQVNNQSIFLNKIVYLFKTISSDELGAILRLFGSIHIEETLSSIGALIDNGKLYDLIGDVYAVLGVTSNGLQSISQPLKVNSSFKIKDMRSEFIKRTKFTVSRSTDRYRYCDQIDIDLDPRFQIVTYIKCLNIDGKYQDLENAVIELDSIKDSNGESYLIFIFNQITKLNLTPKQALSWVQLWAKAYDSGEFEKELSGLLSFVLNNSKNKDVVASRFGQFDESKKTKILKIIKKVILSNSLKHGSGALPSFSDEGSFSLRITKQVKADIFRSLGQNECKQDGCNYSQLMEMRAREYFKSVQSHEWLNGKYIERLSGASLGRLISPVLNKIFNFKQSDPGAPLLSQLLKIVEENDLSKWVTLWSQDTQVIQFWYPGDPAPKTKVVNSLDRWALLIESSDFILWNLDWSILPDEANSNNALRFLYLISQPTMSLDQVYKVILETVSKFEKYSWMLGEDSNRRLFNIKQVLNVVEENLPNSNHKHAGGLKILRNFLSAVWNSNTPKVKNMAIHAAKLGDQNNHTVILRLAQAGAFRWLGRNLLGRQVDGLGRAPNFDFEIKTIQKFVRSKDWLYFLNNPTNATTLEALSFNAILEYNEVAYTDPGFGYSISNLITTLSTLDFLPKILDDLGAHIKTFTLPKNINAHFGVNYLWINTIAEKLKTKETQILLREIQADGGFQLIPELVISLSDGLNFDDLVQMDPESLLVIKHWANFLIDDQNDVAVALRQFIGDFFWSDQRNNSDLDRLSKIYAQKPEQMQKLLETLRDSLRDGSLNGFFEMARQNLGSR